MDHHLNECLQSSQPIVTVNQIPTVSMTTVQSGPNISIMQLPVISVTYISIQVTSSLMSLRIRDFNKVCLLKNYIHITKHSRVNIATMAFSKNLYYREYLTLVFNTIF